MWHPIKHYKTIHHHKMLVLRHCFRCGLYWLTFFGVGIVASASGQKQCGQICKLFGEGARLCGAVLILYFFMVILSTALLLIGGKGGA